VAKVLVLAFKNEAGQNVNIRVRYPREDLTGQEVLGVMNTIIQKNVFPTTGGDLVEAVGAYVEETTRTNL
jgi:hypothetical protein